MTVATVFIYTFLLKIGHILILFTELRKHSMVCILNCSRTNGQGKNHCQNYFSEAFVCDLRSINATHRTYQMFAHVFLCGGMNRLTGF